uniref:General transcription factor IIH subunit 3 n=1 Tax=Meloidogyne javanica TaxID=6303 RepID=A0A915M4M3_MELJA
MSSFTSVIVDCDSTNWGMLISKYPETNVLEDIFSAVIALSGGAKLANKKFQEVETDKTALDFAKSLEIFLRKKLEENVNYEEPASSQYSGAISLSICAFNKYSKQYSNSSGSIIIINLAQNLSNEHSTLMNLFFAAKHSSLVVNSVSLNGNVPILQQASDITGGTNVVLDNIKLLAQTVL